MDLREKIAGVLAERGGCHRLSAGYQVCLANADAILALPEIKEAQDRIKELEAQIEAAEEDADGYRRYPDSWA